MRQDCLIYITRRLVAIKKDTIAQKFACAKQLKA